MHQNPQRAASAMAVTMALLASSPVVAQEAEAAKDIIVTAQQAQKQVISNADLGALGKKSALETPFNVTSYTAQLVLDQQYHVAMLADHRVEAAVHVGIYVE